MQANHGISWQNTILIVTVYNFHHLHVKQRRVHGQIKWILTTKIHQWHHKIKLHVLMQTRKANGDEDDANRYNCCNDLKHERRLRINYKNLVRKWLFKIRFCHIYYQLTHPWVRIGSQAGSSCSVNFESRTHNKHQPIGLFMNKLHKKYN